MIGADGAFSGRELRIAAYIVAAYLVAALAAAAFGIEPGIPRSDVAYAPDRVAEAQPLPADAG